MAWVRRAVFASALLLCAGLGFAEPPFVGLTTAERLALQSFEPVSRIARNAERLAVPTSAPGYSELVLSLKKLRPNYLVEVMASVPMADRDIAGILVSALSKPESWIGIPYYSERYEKTYDLFDKALVRSRAVKAGGETFEVLHHMQPFDDYSANYEYRASSASVVFSGSNTSPLVYKDIKAVEPGSMVWRLLAWREGTVWYFYGVGAVKAFDFFGAARDRLEPSFIGRTEAFFKYMRKRMGVD